MGVPDVHKHVQAVPFTLAGTPACIQPRSGGWDCWGWLTDQTLIRPSEDLRCYLAGGAERYSRPIENGALATLVHVHIAEPVVPRVLLMCTVALQVQAQCQQELGKEILLFRLCLCHCTQCLYHQISDHSWKFLPILRLA